MQSMRSIKIKTSPCIVNKSRVISLPFYKRWLEEMLRANPRLLGAIMLRLGKTNAVSPPDYVKIETTNACNGNCVYCPRDKMSRQIGVMRVELFYKIIDELVKLEIPAIHLQNYGEPLMDPQIITRVKYAKEKGIKHVNLFTNGMLLTANLIYGLMDAGLDEINISLDSCDKETHDTLRKSLSYDIITKNIENLINIRRERKLPKPKITLASVIHSESGSSTREFINYWGKVVEEIHFQKAHGWALEESLKAGCLFPCFRLWSTFTILWDGRVSVCCVDYDGKYILGDSNNTSLRQIWNNEKYTRMRFLHLKPAGYQIDLCRNCTLRLKDSPLWIKKIVFRE